MSDSLQKKQIVVASGNRNKISELQTVAEHFHLQLLSPAEASGIFELAPPPDVNETAQTYHGNALLKAQAFAEWAGMAALGDDSGLEVSVLDNAPGVYSARYGGAGLSDAERCSKLLDEVAQKLQASGSADRSARFRCCLVLVKPDGEQLTEEGVLEGELLETPRGTNGFGYDPIVHINELGKTLAEVDFDVVCDKGFRAQAARKLFSRL